MKPNPKHNPANFPLENGKHALVRCPECHSENYAPNVISGICTWCGYDINHKENNIDTDTNTNNNNTNNNKDAQ